MKIAIFTALFGLLFAVGLQAQTAEDCIAGYESIKAQFEATAADAEVYCVKHGNLISLEREGAFPDFCRGKGSWDHWHLEAKAVGANEGSCSLKLRGQEGVDGCETEELVIELPAKEAAAWRKFLREECN